MKRNPLPDSSKKKKLAENGIIFQSNLDMIMETSE